MHNVNNNQLVSEWIMPRQVEEQKHFVVKDITDLNACRTFIITKS